MVDHPGDLVGSGHLGLGGANPRLEAAIEGAKGTVAAGDRGSGLEKVSLDSLSWPNPRLVRPVYPKARGRRWVARGRASGPFFDNWVFIQVPHGDSPTLTFGQVGMSLAGLSWSTHVHPRWTTHVHSDRPPAALVKLLDPRHIPLSTTHRRKRLEPRSVLQTIQQEPETSSRRWTRA